MLNFIQEAFDEKLQEYFDLTDEMLLVGRNIARRMKKDYVDLDNDDSIDKIKLYIVTNKVLSDKINVKTFLIRGLSLTYGVSSDSMICINRERTENPY